MKVKVKGFGSLGIAVVDAPSGGKFVILEIPPYV
jgi:hypothetical protein